MSSSLLRPVSASGLSTFEAQLKLGITGLVVGILSLVGLLLQAWGWSPLGIATALFFLMYPLVFMGWKIWDHWSSPLMQLTAYTQAIGAGDQTIQPVGLGYSILVDGLFDEIERSINPSPEQGKGLQQYVPHQDVYHTFTLLFDSLPVAIWVFNENARLTYANPKALAVPDLSVIIGGRAQTLGFVWEDGQMSHPSLSQYWQCLTSDLSLFGNALFILSAHDISAELQRNEQVVQNNLVRVLSHELRNSLTPMNSLADTLLSMEEWREAQVRMVLERIRDRSESLLGFVERFASVAKIPEAHRESFPLSQIIEQAELLLRENDELIILGDQTCDADPDLMAQVLVNVVKNAIEAVPQPTSAKITLRYFVQDDWQNIYVEDNGVGFANSENALTPLYTTKPQGAGIGLALVGAIMNRHRGHVTLGASPEGGAQVQLRWPLR